MRKDGDIGKDDFYRFFDARKEELLSRIEKAMGKSIARQIPEIDQDEAFSLETVEDE